MGEAWNQLFGSPATPSEDVLAAERQLHDMSSRISQIQTTLQKDYGPPGFITLREKCIEGQMGKYLYKICPFRQVSQDHTTLGRWKGWEDGSKKMIFDNGQYCHGIGPRTTQVELECGLEVSCTY